MYFDFSGIKPQGMRIRGPKQYNGGGVMMPESYDAQYEKEDFEPAAKLGVSNFQDLEVYQIALRLATEVFQISKGFPTDEIQALTPQVRNTARAIAGEIAGGWGKIKREGLFRRHLREATGYANEMLVHFDAMLACSYISKEKFGVMTEAYSALAKRIEQIHANWRTFDQLYSNWRSVF